MKNKPDSQVKILLNDDHESGIITISGEALGALLEVAHREKLSLPQVLAQSIALQKAVVDAKGEGRRVFIESKGDRPLELLGA